MHFIQTVLVAIGLFGAVASFANAAAVRTEEAVQAAPIEAAPTPVAEATPAPDELPAAPAVPITGGEVPAGSSETDQLYYEVERDKFALRTAEIRGGFSYDVGNAYSHVYGGNVEAFWLASPLLSFGISGAAFDTRAKSATNRLTAQAARSGLALDYATPRYAGRAVVRLTPVTGLLNFMAAGVGEGNLSLVFRGGAIEYAGYGVGPTVGTGVEMAVGFTRLISLHAGIYWDFDRPSTLPWGNRVSLTVGPAIRL